MASPTDRKTDDFGEERFDHLTDLAMVGRRGREGTPRTADEDPGIFSRKFCETAELLETLDRLSEPLFQGGVNERIRVRRDPAADFTQNGLGFLEANSFFQH